MKYKNVLPIMLICLITSSSALSMDHNDNHGIPTKPQKMKRKHTNKSGIQLPNGTFIREENLLKLASNGDLHKNFLPRLLFNAFYDNNASRGEDKLYESYTSRGNRASLFKKTVDLLPKDFFDLEYQGRIREGTTILMLESLLGCKKMVQLLVEMGADASKKDKNGLSALDYALIGYKYYYNCSQQKYAKATIKHKETAFIVEKATDRKNSYNVIKKLLLSCGCTAKDTLIEEDHKRVLESIAVLDGYLNDYLKHFTLSWMY